MKKQITLMIALALLLSIMTGTALAVNGNVILREGLTEKSFSRVNVEIDGEMMGGDVPGVLYNSTSMVPVRFITEGLGGSVAWNGARQEVEIKIGNKTMYVRSNSRETMVNGQTKSIPNDVEPPRALSGRIMIPVRFVSEEFGAEVKWDNSSRTVDIRTDRLGAPGNNDQVKQNKIQNITKESINGREAIVIHNSSSAKYNDSRYSNPERLVIDIKNSSFDNRIKGELPSGLSTSTVKAIRTGSHAGDLCRIVLDIRDDFGNVKYEIRPDGNRLVVYVDAEKVAKYQVFQGSTALGEFNTLESAIVEARKWRGSTVLLSGAVVWRFEEQQSSNGKTIVIDPGHGGRDPGAISVSGRTEADLALSVSLDLERELKARGYNVIMTRRTDVFLTLAERPKLANDRRADAFISVHFNSFSSPSATGIETYHVRGRARDAQFAQAVQKELIRETGARDREVKTANFEVIRRSNMPAILVELGFISNPKDEPTLISKAYHQRTARAVADGVDIFFGR